MRSIHFYLPRTKSGTSTIRFRLTIDYKPISVSTGVIIDEQFWDKRRSKAKSGYKFSSDINRSLREIEDKAIQVLEELKYRDQLSKENFLRLYAEDDNKPTVKSSVFDIIDNYLIPDKIAEGRVNETIKAHKTAKVKLEMYCEFKGIDFDRLTLESIMEYSFYLDYLKFLNYEKGYSLNYQGTLIKNLMVIINHSRDIGIHNLQLKKKFKKPKEAVKPIVLDAEELSKLESCTAYNLGEQKAADWFLISAACGLRISDFLKLNKTSFNHTENLIVVRTQKNNNRIVEIPIAKVIHRVMNKYGGELPPTMCEPTFNQHIKTACQKAGIDNLIQIERKIRGKVQIEQVEKHKKITAHCGRRSFATRAYKDKILDLESLRLITGHSDIKTLMLYINVDQKEAVAQMQKNMDAMGW